MDSLDFTKMKRDPKKVSNWLRIVNNLTVTTQDLSVIIPSRYIDSKLAVIDTTVKTVGIYAITNNKDTYSIVNTSCNHILCPYVIRDITIEGAEYKSLEFKKGDPFLVSNTIVADAVILMDIFEEFCSKGNIPVFLNYNDLSSIIAYSAKFNMHKVGNDTLAMELLTSVMARSAKNKYHVHRLHFKDGLEFIGLNDIHYSFDNTGSKLIGGYFADGITNAIVNPEEKTTEHSNILRS